MKVASPRSDFDSGSPTALADEPVVILGVFRGGTSSVATAISHLGVFLGDERAFEPANEQNPGGYWELQDMQQLNAKILNALGMNYFQADRLPDRWRELPGGDHMVEDLRSLLRRHFGGRPSWGWKEPSTTLLMPVYRRALEEEGVTPQYAVCMRHPLSVARSQRSRQIAWGYQDPADEDANRMPIETRTVGVWLFYTLSALKESANARRHMFFYDRFLADPEPYIRRLANDQRHKPSEDQIQAAIGSIKPQWSHSKYTVEDLENLPSIVGRTYDLGMRADRDPEGLNNGRYDPEIEELWQEWIATTELAVPMALPAGQMYFSYKVNNQLVQQVQYFTPTGKWQTVRKELEAPAGATIQLDPFQTPCQVWIRRAVWRSGGKEKSILMKAGPNGILEDLGMRRLTVFGHGSLMIQAPPQGGKAQLEIEFLVQNGPNTLNVVIAMLREHMTQVKRDAFAEAFRMRR